MGIEMNLEQSVNQATSVQSLYQSQLSTFQSLQRLIEGFSAEKTVLKGQAYDAARTYYELVLLPLVKGVELYAEILARATARLHEDYRTSVDGKSWSEEQLLSYIDQEQSMIVHLEDMSYALMGLDIPQEQKHSLQLNQTELLRGHYANRQIYETILQDLYTYDRASAHLFDELADIEAQLTKSFSQVANSWNPQSNSFVLPKDLSWSQTLSAYAFGKGMKMTKAEVTFMATMMEQYGFDGQTAYQMLVIRRGLKEQFPDKDQKELDYIFLRLMGGASYDGFEWDETAGYLTNYFYSMSAFALATGDPTRTPKSLVEIFQELGLTEEQAKQLRYNLRLQHEMASGEYRMSEYINKHNPSFYDAAKTSYQSIYGTTTGFDEFWDAHLRTYSGKPDFTHQSITMATHLNPVWFQLSDLYGGRDNVKDLAGWEGDTTYNANDMAPSMGIDDYQSDLDSVNIIARMQEGQTYQEAMTAYYKALQKDPSLREREFLRQKSWDEVKMTVYTGLVPEEFRSKGEKHTRDYIAQHYPQVALFLERLEAVQMK